MPWSRYPRNRAYVDAIRERASRHEGVQITDLSFTPVGRAFQHPRNFEPKDRPVYLTARKASETDFDEAEPPEPGCVKSRKSISLTEEEKKRELAADLQRYLVVGWVPQGIELTETEPRQRAYGKVFGTIRPSTSDIITYDPNDIDNLPLIAVAEAVQDTPYTPPIKLYVLLHQSDGLCTPYAIDASNVFYLSIFRNNSADARLRRITWNRLVWGFTSRRKTTADKKPGEQRGLKRERVEGEAVVSQPVAKKTQYGRSIYEEIAIICKFSEPKHEGIAAPPIKFEIDALHYFSRLGAAKDAQFSEEQARALVEELPVSHQNLASKTWQLYLFGRAMILATPICMELGHTKLYAEEGVRQIQEGLDNGSLNDELLRSDPEDEEQCEELVKIARSVHSQVADLLASQEYRQADDFDE